MKWISAIIKPFRLDEVREALTGLGVAGITVSDVKGFGRQKGHVEMYRGTEYAVDFSAKIRIDVAVEDGDVDAVIRAISGAAKVGRIGDGKIFISDLGQAVRIRTGEFGSDAL